MLVLLVPKVGRLVAFSLQGLRLPLGNFKVGGRWTEDETRTYKCPHTTYHSYSWWFQAIWKILVKIGHFPQIEVNIWNKLKPPASNIWFFGGPLVCVSSYFATQCIANNLSFSRSYSKWHYHHQHEAIFLKPHAVPHLIQDTSHHQDYCIF